MRLFLIAFIFVGTFCVHWLYTKTYRICVLKLDTRVPFKVVFPNITNNIVPEPVSLSVDKIISVQANLICCDIHENSSNLVAERFGVISDCLSVARSSPQFVPLFHTLDPMPSLLESLQSDDDFNRSDMNVDWEDKFDKFISIVKANYTIFKDSYVDLLPDQKWVHLFSNFIYRQYTTYKLHVIPNMNTPFVVAKNLCYDNKKRAFYFYRPEMYALSFRGYHNACIIYSFTHIPRLSLGLGIRN